MAEQVAIHSLRGVALMTSRRLAPETVRKFILGKGTPTLATRQALGELYRRYNAEGIVAEPEDEGRTKRWMARPRLSQLLPPGKEAARAELERVFELMRRVPGNLPLDVVDRIHEWMDLQIRGEYWAEDYYGKLARGEIQREPDPGEVRPRRTRKKKTQNDDAGE